MSLIRIILAIAQTVAAARMWQLVRWYANLPDLYPPEVIAAAHVTRPAGLVSTACAATACAAVLWYIVIRRAEK